MRRCGVAVRLALRGRNRLLGLVAFGAAAMLGGCHDLITRTFAASMLDRSLLVQTFDEKFEAPPSFWNAQTNPTGRWKTNFYFGIQDVDAPDGWQSRTLQPNGEGEYYGDPAAGMNPFEWSKGQLTIVGRPNPYRDDARTHHQPYLSGLITTEKSFNQRYGYFEIRAALPQGTGIWPAFWLLPQPNMVNGWAQSAGQQEIDIFETIGEPGKLYFTNFTDDGGRKVPDEIGRQYYSNADLTQFHTYGLLLTSRDIVWYFDDREVRRRPNLNFHMPAFMLINLAVGGNWPGMPDASTPFPARLKIAWVKAYRIK
jgi:beta-glucanase (GH16 family)